jgi:hypothetical protein
LPADRFGAITLLLLPTIGTAAIGRTVISTVPTLLQRRGIFTETIGGRVRSSMIATTVSTGAGVATANTVHQQRHSDRRSIRWRVLLALIADQFR